MQAIEYAVRWLLRFIIVWVVDIISLVVAAAIVPGITYQLSAGQSPFVAAAAVAFMLGLVNVLIRPLVLLLTLPLGFFVTFVIAFLVNAFALLITSALLPAFQVSGFVPAFFGGLIMGIVNTIITGIITVDDQDSFYQGVVERLARRQGFRGAAEPGRGLVMIEIDGLSYWHMQHALEKGLLPTLQEMIDQEGYVLSRVDCGLPSQTSACQAGIMFGNNDDIPAFRWYDKDRKRLIVSGKDAAELNARYASGQGLMRGGSSINNMMNGDAEKSMLTLANLRTGTNEEKSRRAKDVYLLAVNPYFLMRAMVLLLGAAIREVYQYWQACRKDVQPRLNRLHGFYPFVRAATTVFMGDVAAYLATLDIIRGAPSIYVTWPGYDEVAHHSGPWSDDAFGELKRYDATIARIRDIIRRKAPRPYELVILSDHGQAFGATFAQRYGLSLKEFIEQHLPAGTSVGQTMAGDTGITSLAGLSGELENIQEQGVAGKVGGAVVKSGQRLTQNAVDKSEAESKKGEEVPQVIAYGSGNLAQVYFTEFPARTTLSELSTRFPGVVDSLVNHEAIGFVVGYDDDCRPVVLGKGGSRHLHTGEVRGADPLAPYGDVDLRSWQVRRVMDFPHAGDLMVMSTVFPDKTVAALEELIGSHGGLGGEQTDAFLFHPKDLVVPPTRNSVDVFHILNARRGLPAPEPKIEAPAGPPPRSWTPGHLARGIFHQPSRWLGLALRCLLLDRRAYADVARDPYMTGPALLIAVIGSLLITIARPGDTNPVTLVGPIAVWLLAELVLYGAARLLGGRAHYTRTLRAAGFAASAFFLSLLGLIPFFAPIARTVTVLVSFLAVWIGAAEAQELRGWRTIVLPVVAIVLLFGGVAVLTALFSGAALTLNTLAQQFGLIR